MKKNIIAFTLVELVVTATILVILTSIGFYSYTQNISDARDGKRKTDLSSLSSQLNLYKRQRGAFPTPWDSFEIRNRGYTVAYQWLMNQKVTLSTAEKLPLDPEMDIPYFYSISRNKQEFQLALSLENNENPYALVDGNYKSVSKNVLPTILLALSSTLPIEISTASGSSNRNYFIFQDGYHTLPYDFDTGIPSSDGTSFSILLADAGISFWQNSDYRNCWEIFTAAKWIGPSGTSDEYQILWSTWALINTGCLAP